MSVLNEDTIWLVASSGFDGGVFRTTNGGESWQQQLNLGSQNPSYIYMYNGRIGFICELNNYIRKTTNSGLNWFIIPGEIGFTDMYFVDNSVGWSCGGAIDSIKKTTNGGLNWFKQFLPPEGVPLFFSRMLKFTFVNKDTGWGVGGSYSYTGFPLKGIIYKTTNGGNNWGYQLPDTNINIGRYSHVYFFNQLTGWAYSGPTGVHTVTGGDTTFYTGIVQQVSTIPQYFIMLPCSAARLSTKLSEI
jgi:photosystem II stability/assembly factor-like uncharacterized protein